MPGEAEGAGEAGSSGKGVSVGQVQELLSTGLAVELRLESLERLQTILHEHSVWERQMKQVLEGDILSQLYWSAASPLQGSCFSHMFNAVSNREP